MKRLTVNIEQILLPYDCNRSRSGGELRRDLFELCDHIAKNGQLAHCLVHEEVRIEPVGPILYRLMAGTKRFVALILIGAKTIDIQVLESSDHQPGKVIDLHENDPANHRSI